MEIHSRKLLSEYDCSSTLTCDESTHNNHVIPYLVSAACVLGVAFLLLTTCTILLRHRWSRRRTSVRVQSTTSDEDSGSVDHPIWHIVTIGLPQSVIDSITTVNYKSCDGKIVDSDCSVCLTKFEDGDEIRVLPKCSHAFHLPCIDTWLRSHKNCPLCRSPVVNSESPPVILTDLNPNSSNPDPSENSTELPESEFDDSVVEDGARIGEISKIDPEKRVLSDLGENVRVSSDNFQPVMRSISFDSSDLVHTITGEGSCSKQEKMMELEEEDHGGDSSSISRLIKSAKILSSFRGSKSQSSSSTTILPL